MTASGIGARYPLRHSQQSAHGLEIANGGLIGYAVFAVWLLLVIDGLWTYGTYRALGGRLIPLSPFAFLALGLAAVNGVLEKRQFAIDSRLTTLSWLFAAYLLAISMYQAQIDNGFLLVIWKGYYLNYFYILAFPALGVLRGSLKPTFARFSLAVLALGLAALGTAQHFTHNLFEVGRTIAAQAEAFNLGFAGRVRANGLFAHSEDLGFFLALVAAIAVASFWRASFGYRVCWAVVWIALAVGCYSTITRSAYIAFAFASLVSCALTFSSKSNVVVTRKLLFAPLAMLVVALILFYGRAFISSLFTGDVLFSSSSLDDRIYGSLYYIRQLQFGGLPSVLFGKGWYLFSNAHAVVALDNGFLGVVVNSGLVGLLFWLAITGGAWIYIVKQALISKDPLHIGLAAFYSTWLALSVFGVVSLYQFVALLFLMTLRIKST